MSNIKTGWLTVTRKCNNFCEWCYTKNNLNCKSMNYDDAKRGVDNLIKLGANRIVLIGGEPTLYDNVIELIKYIKKQNIRVSMATNGRKLSDIQFSKQLVEAGIDSINISLKGVSEKEYLEYTKAKGLDEALNGYYNLHELGFEHVSLSYVIVDDNKEKFDELVKLIETRKLKNILFQFVKPVLEIKEGDDLLNVKDMGKFVTYIYNKMKHTKTNYCLEVSFPLCTIDEEILNKLIEEKRIITCCHISSGKGMIFDTDFRILPCNHFAEYPYSEEPIGLKEAKDIDEFFESELCNNLRKTASCYPSQKCIDCKLWDVCGGGCFTRWFYQKPDDVILGMKGGELNETK